MQIIVQVFVQVFVHICGLDQLRSRSHPSCRTIHSCKHNVATTSLTNTIMSALPSTKLVKGQMFDYEYEIADSCEKQTNRRSFPSEIPDSQPDAYTSCSDDEISRLNLEPIDNDCVPDTSFGLGEPALGVSAANSSCSVETRLIPGGTKLTPKTSHVSCSYA